MLFVTNSLDFKVALMMVMFSQVVVMLVMFLQAVEMMVLLVMVMFLQVVLFDLERMRRSSIYMEEANLEKMVIIIIFMIISIIKFSQKNAAKLYGDALLYTAVFFDWLDSRSPAVFMD